MLQAEGRTSSTAVRMKPIAAISNQLFAFRNNLNLSMSRTVYDVKPSSLWRPAAVTTELVSIFVF